MKRGLCVLAFMASFAVIYQCLSEVAVRWEMWHTGLTSRAALASDLGFGLLLLPVLVGSVLGAGAVSWAVWRGQRAVRG